MGQVLGQIAAEMDARGYLQEVARPSFPVPSAFAHAQDVALHRAGRSEHVECEVEEQILEPCPVALDAGAARIGSDHRVPASLEGASPSRTEYHHSAQHSSVTFADCPGLNVDPFKSSRRYVVQMRTCT